MNYEEFYAQMQGVEKELKDKIASIQKLYKNIEKETENGDVKSMERDIRLLSDLAAQQAEAAQKLQAAVEGFDTKAYFESGDFEKQLLEYCEKNGVDVKGEFPVYEMFPYRVRMDVESQDLYLNRKKVQCMRPSSFAALVKAGQDKLNKVSFNALSFAGELADAYDMAALKNGKRAGTDIYLTSLYKFLTPMGRFRRDYDQNSFAFDLARLYISGLEETKSGRRFQFGTSRNNAKAIRILDQEGKEQYLATICFYEA